MRSVLVGGPVLIVGLLVAGGSALAHAFLVKAEPPAGAAISTSPEIITLFFSEEIEPQFSAFTLYDAQGHRLKELPFAIAENGLRVVIRPETLADGVYTLAWKVLSAIDGHVTNGVYPFGIGAHAEHSAHTPTEPVAGTAAPLDLLRIFSRWVHYLALGVLVGGIAFRALVLLPAQSRLATSFAQIARPVEQALWFAWGLAVLTSMSELFLQARSLTDEPFSVWLSNGVLHKVLFDTQFGFSWLMRSSLLLALGFLLSVGTARRASWLGLALGAGALLSFSSHSAGLRENAALAITFDLLHFFSVALWIGGLVALGLILRQSRAGQDRAQVAASLMPRFSQLALVSVTVLIGSGIYLAWRHISSWEALWSTDYGKLILIKVGLLLFILGMAGLNLRQVRRDFRGTYTGAEAGLSFLRRRVWGEFFTVVLVLGAAGALTLSPPAHAPVPARTAPTVLVHDADGIRVTLTVSSLRVGSARFEVQLADSHGQPLHDVLRVTLEFVYSEELGTMTAIAEPTGEGRYETHGTLLSLAGEWKITVRVRLKDRADDLQAPFQVVAKSS